MVRLFINTVLLLALTTTSALAVEEKKAVRLAKDFTKAFNAKDAEKVDELYLRLTKDQDSLRFIEENLPYHYSLYKYHSLSLRLEDMQNGASALPPATLTSFEPSSKGKSVTNTTNADRKSNSQITTTNRDKTLARTNQDRPSIQDRISSRRDAPDNNAFRHRASNRDRATR